MNKNDEQIVVRRYLNYRKKFEFFIRVFEVCRPKSIHNYRLANRYKVCCEAYEEYKKGLLGVEALKTRSLPLYDYINKYLKKEYEIILKEDQYFGWGADFQLFYKEVSVKFVLN